MNSNAKLLLAGSVKREVGLHEAREIARTELARRRRRLGELTREQEIGVEELIMSTVTKVLEVAGTALDSLPLVHESREPLARRNSSWF